MEPALRLGLEVGALSGIGVFLAGTTANSTGARTTQAARNLFLRTDDRLDGARALVREHLDRTIIWNQRQSTTTTATDLTALSTNDRHGLLRRRRPRANVTFRS